MSNIELIKKKLPENLREIASKYSINDKMLIKNSDLIVLILNSKSMETKEEKQTWFDLFPIMNQEQINKLYDILNREKNKLKEIEEKYSKKKKQIKEKYEKRWEAMGYHKKIEDIRKRESEHKEQEMEDAESLLENL